MPELPEVETVRRGLVQALLCKRFSDVFVYRSDLRFPIPENFCSALKGRTVSELVRRGKYIVGILDSGCAFILHLGMSGRVKIFDSQTPYHPEKHDHVMLETEDGIRIVYHDPRRFGFIRLEDAAKWQELPPFDRMGPEPMAEEHVFNGQVLREVLLSRSGPVKNVLLDQRVVAGLGNIYVCEALFDAGISPERSAYSLGESECSRLARSIRKILERAIDAGGSTLRDYQKTDGSLGYFQHQFSVYGREGRPCGGCDCGKGAVVRTVQAGRSTFSCPVKQV